MRRPRTSRRSSAKASAHDVGNYTGTHNPAEADPVATTHVECVDCHNPHAAYASALPTLGRQHGAHASGLAGRHQGRQHRRHGGEPGRVRVRDLLPLPQQQQPGGVAHRAPARPEQHAAGVPAWATRPSIRWRPSGRSTTVPSLLSPWTTSSRIKCTDCHNNNAGPYSTGTGTTPSGTGVNGPHGSTYPLLLERQYVDHRQHDGERGGLCALLQVPQPDEHPRRRHRQLQGTPQAHQSARERPATSATTRTASAARRARRPQRAVDQLPDSES